MFGLPHLFKSRIAQSDSRLVREQHCVLATTVAGIYECNSSCLLFSEFSVLSVNFVFYFWKVVFG